MYLFVYISLQPSKPAQTQLTRLPYHHQHDLLRFRFKGFVRTYDKLLRLLIRESERDSVNSVVWYILEINFVPSLYPQDVATVAILILSWADTAVSTFGRLYGSHIRKLPARLPLLRLSLAPRKSLAGFTAATTITGAAAALGFWGFVAPIRNGGLDISWTWQGGVGQATGRKPTSVGAGVLFGLLAISVVARLVSGVAEALDLESLDDNLTLPMIPGACILE